MRSQYLELYEEGLCAIEDVLMLSLSFVSNYYIWDKLDEVVVIWSKIFNANL